MTDWLTSVQFASLAGISPQRARKICLEIERGDRLHWQGCTLEICIACKRGGASGKNYLIKASSLPPDIQERSKALQTSLEAPSLPAFPDDHSAREHLWWKALLAPALQYPKHSRERSAALNDIAGRQHFDWSGQPISVCLRTLYRHAKKHELDVKLSRKGRSDKGQKRHLVTRRWDKAVPFDDATKAKIADDLKQEIRGLIKGGMAWGLVLLHSQRFLVKATQAYGFRPDNPAFLEHICAIPKHLQTAELHYRKVHQFKRDRKVYEDSKPRIRRGLPGRPMEIVVADVHPVDILLTRRDGTTATARLLGFLDWATWRVWCELVFIDGRGGVRNVDLIEAFGAMAEHPAFGLPENLYIDNGSEYLFAPYLDDAMRLNVQSFSKPGQFHSTVIKARPYNASAKPIESFFKNLEARFLSALPGWIGGDRMNKKQEAVGRPVAPLGSFEDFVPAFYGVLRAYEHTPYGKGSKLKGKSPAMAFKEYVDGGWTATVMSRDEIRAACARTEIRDVVQGAIRFRNEPWSCPELWDYPHDKVQVRVPAYHEPAELLLLNLNGERLGIATPKTSFHPLDRRGAQEAAAAGKAHKSMIRRLNKASPTVDIAERLATFGREQADVIPNQPNGRVTFDPSSRPAKVLAIGHSKQKTAADQQSDAEEIAAIRRQVIDNAKRMRAS